MGFVRRGRFSDPSPPGGLGFALIKPLALDPPLGHWLSRVTIETTPSFSLCLCSHGTGGRGAEREGEKTKKGGKRRRRSRGEADSSQPADDSFWFLYYFLFFSSSSFSRRVPVHYWQPPQSLMVLVISVGRKKRGGGGWAADDVCACVLSVFRRCLCTLCLLHNFYLRWQPACGATPLPPPRSYSVVSY